MKQILAIFFISYLGACNQKTQIVDVTPVFKDVNIYKRPVLNNRFYLAGHRGYSSYYPENTISSFIRAIDVGVDVLEMDVCISKDMKVVVSHEQYMNSDYTNKPNGIPLIKAEESSHIIYQMLYEDIKKFDVGSRTTSYSNIKNLYPEYKPLLSEVLEKCEQYIEQKNRKPVIYLIELKSIRIPQGKWQPSSDIEYCRLVNDVIKTIDSKKIIINSFDSILLNEWNNGRQRELYKNIPLGYLVNVKDTITSAQRHIEGLGFVPEIFEPYYGYQAAETDINFCHSKGIKVFLWTINSLKNMRVLKSYDADGFITDFPNVYVQNF
jgi:glycerophosphoryl diester phosphodiesterase